MRLLKYIFIAVLMLKMPFCFASSFDNALIASMAQNKTWINLLHYKPNILLLGKYQSTVHEESFFLSANGRHDPLYELEALISSINLPPEGNNSHVRCKFPARVKWIEASLNMTSQFDVAKHCPLLSEWRHQGKKQSISIILASGYLKNPASFYGHTFIKFNSHDQKLQQAGNNLLNNTINYGAVDTSNENPMMYIVKSISGGYDAAFKKVDFYQQDQNYTENENRDLWEYELNLTQDQVDFLTDHTWETIDKKYTYYFFRENCAFRMIELLEVLPNINITDQFNVYAIPQSVIQKIKTTRYNNASLVKKVNYYPSRQSRLYAKYLALSKVDKQTFKALIESNMDQSNLNYVNAPSENKAAIIDATIDYYSFIEDNKFKQVSAKTPQYVEALKLRFGLPSSNNIESAIPENSPEKGRPPSWVQMGHIYSNEFGGGTSINIRPAYYDQLDSNSAHVKNASLTMFETQFVAVNNQISLRKLDIFSVDSVNPGLTGLKNDTSQAWKAKIGAEQARVGCNDCLVPRFQGDYGYGKTIFNDLFIAGYLGGAIQNDRPRKNNFFTRTRLEGIYRPNDSFGVKVNHEYRFNLKDGENENIINLDLRWAPVTNFDVRLSYAVQYGFHHSDMTQLGAGYYW